MLCLVLAIAAFLRLHRLDSIPPGFYSDEAFIAYDAYSIWRTGRDHFGVLFPVFPQGSGFWIAGLRNYAAIPSLAVFGLNEFGARFPSAAAGILTVLLTYLVVRLRFTSGAALWASLLLAIAPWHVHLSRVGTEYVLLPLFFMAGLYFFLRGLQGRTLSLYLSAFSFGLAFYSYIPGRLFIPISLLGLIVIYRKDFSGRARHILGSAIVLILTLTPAMIFALRQPEHFFLRYRQIAIAQEGRPLGDAASIFIRNYLAHISPVFLFFKGDANVRHAPKGFGQLCLFELPLAIAGITVCLRNIRRPDARFLLFWLIAYPVPASLTTENIPHALRSITALPLIQILSALGLWKIGTLWKPFAEPKRFLAAAGASLFLALLALDAALFFRHYFLRYSAYSAPAWDYGWREAMECARSKEGDYDRVVLTVLSVGRPSMYPPFYLRYDPALYQRGGLEETKYSFIPPEILAHIHPFLPGRTLYVAREEELRGLAPLRVVRFPDGTVAFKIVETRNPPAIHNPLDARDAR